MKISPLSFFGVLWRSGLAILPSKLIRNASALVCIIFISQGFSYKKISSSSNLDEDEIAVFALFMDSDGDGIDDGVDIDDDNDGIPDTEECGTFLCSQPIINESFDIQNPPLATRWRPYQESQIPGWLTTASDGRIEIWVNGFLGVPASDGTHLAELNANRPGALYQELCLTPGTVLNWSVDHRGRAGTDVARVRIGASLATATTQIVMTSPRGSWSSYSGTYTVPAGQTSTFFMFEAVSTATGSLSVGNLIDNVQISVTSTPECNDDDQDGIPNSLDLDADNDGIMDIIEAGGVDADGDGRVDYPIPGDPTSMVDADGDGLADAFDNVDSGSGAGEVTSGTPLPTLDTDLDGRADLYDIDADNDGIVDNVEAQSTTGYIPPSGNDADGDGIDDAYDATQGGTVITPVNSGGAIVPDYRDINSDGDIESDNIEAYDTNNDGISDTVLTGNDSDNDGLDDAFDTVDLNAVVTPGTGVSNNNATNNGTLPTDFPDVDTPGGDRDWREYIVDFELLKRDVFNDENGDGRVQVGETITYLFTVDNTGDIEITGISITDPIVTIMGGPLASLNGRSVDNATFTATYTITATDLANGNVTNTAIVNATGPAGEALSDASDDPDDNADVDPDTDGDPDDPTVFLIDTFEPEIRFIKTAQNAASSANIANGTVNLGDQFNYRIQLQNIGNDDATNIEVTDVLPVGLDFVSSSLAGTTYDSGTRTVTIPINDNTMEVGDPLLNIDLLVEVSNQCDDFRDACAGILENQANISYDRVNSTGANFNVDSYPTLADYNADTPGPVTVNVDLTSCTFVRDEIICNNSLTISAGNGFTNYEWRDASNTVIGNSQSVTVTSPGTYTVSKTNTPPNTCPNNTEVINVIPFGSDPHPLQASVGDTDIDVKTCANDGSQKYEVYLCGASATRLLETNFVNIQSIQWQQLDETSCTVNTSQGCATLDAACTWNTLASSANFTVSDAGQYRILVTYPNGCFRFFYFDVFKNPLDPNPVAENIICGNPGSITVNGVGSNYEFSIDNGTNWQTGNSFSIATAGTYDVLIRQITAPIFGCEFLLEDIIIAEEDIAVDTFVTDEVCTINGNIRFQVNGVSPTYIYTLSQSGSTVATFGPTADNDHTFANLAPGDYDVEITNNDGCSYTNPTPITIADYPNFSASASVTQNITCQDGEITVTPTGGIPPYSYSIDGGTTQQIGNTFPITTAGNYTITVEDDNGCTVDSNVVNVQQLALPTVSFTNTDVECFGQNTGAIQVDITTNNGYSLDYSIDNGATYQASNVFSGLTSGTYTIIVRASNGTAQCPQTFTQTINQPTSAITGLASVTQQLDCDTGTNDAIIEIQAAMGGTAPLQYSIDGVTFGSNPIFENLGASTYSNITIRDANNCSVVLNAVTINPKTEPTDIDYTISAAQCNSVNTIAYDITITSVTGGSAFVDTPTTTAPPIPDHFNYEIIAGPAGVGTALTGGDNVFIDLPSGTYTIRTTDANSCFYDENVTITNTPQISLTTTKTNDVTCLGSTDGAFNFTVSNSTQYDYTITGGPTAVTPGNDITTNAAINIGPLAAGTYTIDVSDDTTGCTVSANVTIDSPPAVLEFDSTNPVVTTPITCFTPNNGGTATINVQGGWGAYQYTLKYPDLTTVVGPQSSNVFNDLDQDGTYRITVTDANSCVILRTFDLDPAVIPTITIDPVSDLCYDGTNQASITVNAASTRIGATFTFREGTDPFTTGTTATSNTFSNLAPGSYTFFVQDDLGCENSVSFTIEPQLTATAVLTKDLDCTASPDALITVTITGGYPDGGGNYLYDVIRDPSGTPTVVTNDATSAGTTIIASIAAAGEYRIDVTDAESCIVQSNTITVTPNTAPVFNATVATITNVECNGENTGIIEVNTITGNGPFEYQLEDDASPTPTVIRPFQTSTTFSGLPAAINYVIRVRDAKQCIVTSATQTVGTNPAIVSNSSFQNIDCIGGFPDGEIRIAASGGTAPYIYTITNPVNGFSDTHDTNVSGNLYVATPSFGNFNIQIVDAFGCELNETITVGQGPDILNFTAGAPGCTPGSGVMTVEADASTILSTGPFYFAIYPAPPFATTDPNWFLQDPINPPYEHTFTGLNPGVTYTFVVHDTSTGCEYFEDATVPVSTSATVTSNISGTTNETCLGSNSGSVTFNVTGYPGGQIDYQLFNSFDNTPVGPVINEPTAAPSNGLNINGIAPGEYYILFTETGGLGCLRASDDFTITGPAALLEVSGNVTSNDDTCSATEQGQITVRGQFGIGPYEYIVEADPSPAPITPPTVGDVRWNNQTIWNNLVGGNYVVWVKDASNCIQQAAALVNVPTDPAPVINPTIVNACAVEGSFAINVALTTAGVAPYQVSLNGGAFQNQATFPFNITDLTSGAYTVNLRDANGCETGNIPVNITSPLAYSATVTNQPSCTNPGNTPIIADGIITMIPNGGSGTQTYELWDAANTTQITLGITIDNIANTISNVSPGNYTVRVIDAAPTACVQPIPITLESPEIPVLNPSDVTNVLCNGQSTGSISARLNFSPPARLNPGYQYELYDSEATYNPALQTLRTGPQNSPNFSGLPAGFYRVRIISGRGCEAYDNVQITETNPLTAGVTVSTFACTANNDPDLSTVTVTGAGGGTPFTPGNTYLYSFNGGSFSSSNTFDIPFIATAQEIVVLVRDVNGCELVIDDGDADGTVEIPPIQKVSATVANPTASQLSCTTTEDIVITIADGSGNYTVTEQPSGSVIGTPGNIQLNNPGLYTYLITDNTTGCNDTVSYTVNPFDEGTVTAINLNNVSCDGFTDGDIQIDVQGYTGNYNYTVVDNISGTPITGPSATGSGVAPGTLDILDLPAGSYRVEIAQTGFPNCNPVSSGLVSIAPPPAPLSVTASRTNDPSCVPGNDGQITATPRGGWGMYELQLEDPATPNVAVLGYDFTSNGNNLIFSNLPAGDYVVRVRDANGCSEPPSNVVNIPVANIITASGTVTSPLVCFNDTNAQITATASGGIGTPFNYILNNVDTGISQAAQVSPVFDDLIAGNYTVTVTDGFGCDITTAVIPVVNPVEVTSTLITFDQVTCLAPGQIRLSAFGGSAPYGYSTSATGPFTAMTGNQVDINVAAGTYQYYIEDASGCVSNASTEVTIQAPTPLDVTLNNDESTLFINCVGESTGVISVEATGGLGNNMFELFNVDPTSVGATAIQGPFSQGVFNGLPAGTTYYIRGTSSDCEDVLGPIIITEPATPIVVDNLDVNDIECNGDGDGSAEIFVSGGTPPYTYIISSDPLRTVNNPLFEDLTPGPYTIIATDARGCFVERPFTITEPLPIDANLVIDNQEICVEDDNASVTVTISGGTAPYSISVNDENGTYNLITGNTATIDMQDGGQSFTIYIEDANMCRGASNTVTLDAPVDLTTSTVITTYNCDQTYDLTIDVDSQYANDVMYSVDGGVNFQLSNLFTNLPSGNTYDLQVMHASGCVYGDDETFEVTLEVFPDLSIRVEQSGIDEFVAQGIDGTAPFEYSIDGITFDTNNVFNVTATGEYTVTVRDAIGCVAQTTIEFEYIGVIVPNFFTPNGDGRNDYWMPTGLEFFPNAQIKVFDRYGRLMKRFRGDFNPGWTGMYENTELPSGDYWYVITLNDGLRPDIKGHFTLYR
ncbi:T9SS type B sorting domain-containing protein [Spongiivirga sp. MCCC 1A20706]|uniref:T9SS type B sorting domain-containing protein n=1 Tax=Spongiivirga sp. MCCC 1A20706 TaxID=3160963 RepID=UPI003977D9EB